MIKINELPSNAKSVAAIKHLPKASVGLYGIDQESTYTRFSSSYKHSTGNITGTVVLNPDNGGLIKSLSASGLANGAGFPTW